MSRRAEGPAISVARLRTLGFIGFDDEIFVGTSHEMPDVSCVALTAIESSAW